MPTASTTGSRCWTQRAGSSQLILGDHRLSRLGKEKLMANPDMIRQRALAYANNPDYERRFDHPNAVKVDRHGRVCVLDPVRGRIQVYTKTNEPGLAQ